MRRIVPVIAVVLVLGLVGPGLVSANAIAGGGFDDWSCRPSAPHPDPVVLLHGLGGDPSTSFDYLGPALASDGFCAFASPYSAPVPGGLPFYGLAPIDDAAADVVAFVDEVLAATGADHVALVGHSEGAFLSLYVPKLADIADRVSTVVAVAPPTHGTSFLTLVTLGRITGTYGPIFEPMLRDGGCPACADLVVDGPAVQRLNDGPIAQPGIDYTVVATRYDALVRNEAYQPATATAFVDEPGVLNLHVQDRCPFDPVGHIGMADDPTVLGIIRHALDPALPLGPCSFGPPL